MANLAVVTADGGVPIFQHATGDIKSKLPFATVGALNGVHMFARLQEAELKRLVTPEEKILWREYHKRLVLILITKDESFSDCHHSNLLDNVFAAMAMLIGFDHLLKMEVVKLQKALANCHTLIDYLLNQIDFERGNLGDLTRATDCMLATETNILQECLGRFLGIADSLYGCLLIKGKVVVASKEWWTLTKQERVLLNAYVNCSPKVLARELIIYLPTSSPQCSNRLVTLHLLKDVEVCVLCSAEPPLSLLEEEAPKVWKNCFDLLKVTSNIYPRNMPSTIDLDKNIVALLLINTKTSQSVCSLLPDRHYSSAAAEAQTSTSNKLLELQEALRSLYKLVVGTYFKNSDLNIDPKLKADHLCPVTDCGDVEFQNCQPEEFYMCLKQHKCYVVHENNFQLYVVFNPDIPMYALRPVARKTLKVLTEKKFFPPV